VSIRRVAIVALGLIQGAAVGLGIYGLMFTSEDWPVWACLLISIFVHLTALAMLSRSRR
jgi:hypothetical protein